jgi:hexosaminidase
MTEYGAYSPRKIYSTEDMKELVEYGRIRGVKVLPEFDAPAHVGESESGISEECLQFQNLSK